MLAALQSTDGEDCFLNFLIFCVLRLSHFTPAVPTGYTVLLPFLLLVLLFLNGSILYSFIAPGKIINGSVS